MTNPIKMWQLLPTENPLVKLSIHLLSVAPSSASIEQIFSLIGDTKTRKWNKMKTKKAAGHYVGQKRSAMLPGKEQDCSTLS